MPRVFITGDLHQSCDIHKLGNSAFKVGKELTREDVLIIAGDVGLVWSYGQEPKGEEKFWRNWLCDKPYTIFCTLGNHENYDLIKEFPIVDFHGGKARKITDNIYYEVRGEIYTFADKTFLSLGGADSTDKEFRREGSSWWKEERIFDCDIENALRNLDKHNKEVDYIISHTGGTDVTSVLGFGVSPSDIQLDKVLRYAKYKHHYCGHLHTDRIIYNSTVIYNDIIEIM